MTSECHAERADQAGGRNRPFPMYWERLIPSTFWFQDHAAGACVLVNSSQLVGHHPIDVKQLGVDFLAWPRTRCLGPEDSACSYGKRSLFETMPPFLGGGGGMVGEVTPEL